MANAASNFSINLSAISYLEDGVWIAHCLELDIVAEGTDAKDAVDSLISLCDLQITTAMEEGDIESIFRAAPPEVWKMFATAKAKVPAKNKKNQHSKGFEAPVDRFEARQLAFV